MSPTPRNVKIEPEPPEQIARNLAMGARIFSSGVAFLFMSFVFAFFYLRALNTNHSFVEPHATPPSTWGVIVLGCVLASVFSFDMARRDVTVRGGAGGSWRLGAFAAVLLGLAAIAIQLVEYLHLTFGATSGGLASVFFGFTAVYGVFWLGAIYWMETLWAQSIRRHSKLEEGTPAPEALLRPSADACMVYLYMMAAIALVAFILLYAIQ